MITVLNPLAMHITTVTRVRKLLTNTTVTKLIMWKMVLTTTPTVITLPIITMVRGMQPTQLPTAIPTRSLLKGIESG